MSATAERVDRPVAGGGALRTVARAVLWFLAAVEAGGLSLALVVVLVAGAVRPDRFAALALLAVSGELSAGSGRS
jgi:hypothetical protein